MQGNKKVIPPWRLVQATLAIILLCICSSALFISCSTRKNTAGTRFYHALTTKYNVYFNGREAYRAGCKAQQKSLNDNYMELLPLTPAAGGQGANVGAADFERAIEKSQKAIREHSIKRRPARKPGRNYTPEYRAWLAQREFNPFLHHAWLLMGQAQFAKGDWAEAAATFSYIARLYAGQPRVTADARIWLARCYAQLGWHYDAEDILTKVNNDSLPYSLLPAYAQAYGGYLLGMKRYPEAVPQLLTTIKNEKNRQQRARQYYLLGQVYQLLGQEANARQAFKKVISLSPPYPLELNARIRCFSNGGSPEKLRRMTRSEKNKDYLDQIQYALGNVYLASGDTAQAITEYRLGIKQSTRAGVEKGMLLLTLANLYWTQAAYAEAQAACAEAIGLIGKEHPEYAQLTKRSTILDELVGVAQTVQLQDSLQQLARLDSTQRMLVIEQLIAQVIRREEEERQAKEEEKRATDRESALNERDALRAEMEATRNEQQAERIQAGKPGSTSAGGSTTGGISTPGMPVTDRSWYFYNPQLVAQGKAEFQRQWGRRKAEDNWRRRNKTVVSLTPSTEAIPEGGDHLEGETQSNASSTTGNLTSESADSLAPEASDSHASQAGNLEEPADEKSPAYYLSQIPLTEAAMQESNAILSDALLHLALIYKDKLEDYVRAEQTLVRLIDHFPDFAELDAAYYHLYLLYLAQEYRAASSPPAQSTPARTASIPSLAENIRAGNTKEALIARFPESKYALTLSDPDFLRNATYGKQLEDSLYADTYQQYRAGNYAQVKVNAQRSATRYAMGAHRAKFLFLHAATALQTGDQPQFLAELKTLVQQYPENEITDIAAHILKEVQSGRTLLSQEASSSPRPVWGLLPDGRRFSNDPNASNATQATHRANADGTTSLSPDSTAQSREWSTETNAPFLFILAYEEGSTNENLLLYHLARYNFSSFLVKNFDLSFAHDRGIGQLIIRPFANHDEALYYFRRLYADPQMNQQLTGLRAILISASNYELLMHARSFDDYATFYAQCFPERFPHQEVSPGDGIDKKKKKPAGQVKEKAGDGSTLDEPLLNLSAEEEDLSPQEAERTQESIEEGTEGGVIYVP